MPTEDADDDKQQPGGETEWSGNPQTESVLVEPTLGDNRSQTGCDEIQAERGHCYPIEIRSGQSAQTSTCIPSSSTRLGGSR